ncbi:MAG: hypothetical protein PHU56_03390 [Candidatus Pacebacteria bacterium]|nr:hypothetical protein [Candidatus Paceibacterota bacterium]
MYKIIIVPGLGDGGRFFRLMVRNWWGMFPNEIHAFGWRDKGVNLIDKQNNLLRRIDALAKEGRKIYLIGISAGGSAILNAFMARRTAVSGVVNVCGRLKEGIGVRPTLEKAARTSEIFAQSVKNCEKELSSLSDSDLKKILTIHPIYDEIVPTSTVGIEGAANIVVPSFFHGVGIRCSMIFWRNKIINFLISRQDS